MAGRDDLRVVTPEGRSDQLADRAFGSFAARRRVAEGKRAVSAGQLVGAR
jgi:hypothetical protein